VAAQSEVSRLAKIQTQKTQNPKIAFAELLRWTETFALRSVPDLRVWYKR